MANNNPNPYIQLNREFQYDPLFRNPKLIKPLRLFLYLRMNTSHEKVILKGVELQKGQLIRSLSQMAEGIGLDYDGANGKAVKQIRDSLDFLEEQGYIRIDRRDHKPSIITVYADQCHSLEVPEFLENKGKK